MTDGRLARRLDFRPVAILPVEVEARDQPDRAVVRLRFSTLKGDKLAERVLRLVERIGHHGLKRIVHRVLVFARNGNKLVTRRDAQIGADAVRVTAHLVTMRPFDGDAATRDMLAELLEVHDLLANQVIDSIAFRDPVAGGFDGDLHRGIAGRPLVKRW